MANYREDFADVELQTGKICRNFMNQTIGSGDALGDRFGVHVFRDGEPVTLGGSCTGYFVRNATGETIVISDGVVSGNEAYVTLPAACYAVEGSFTLAIKVTSGDEVVTLRIVDGMVDRTNTSVIVDPGTIIPSIETLIAAIDAAVASIPADYSSLWTSLAPAFSPSESYVAGQYVTYDGGVYRFKTSHSGSWSSSDVQAVTVGGELYMITSAIKNMTDIALAWDNGLYDTDGSYSAYDYAWYFRPFICSGIPYITIVTEIVLRVVFYSGTTYSTVVSYSLPQAGITQIQVPSNATRCIVSIAECTAKEIQAVKILVPGNLNKDDLYDNSVFPENNYKPSSYVSRAAANGYFEEYCSESGEYWIGAHEGNTINKMTPYTSSDFICIGYRKGTRFTYGAFVNLTTKIFKTYKWNNNGITEHIWDQQLTFDTPGLNPDSYKISYTSNGIYLEYLQSGILVNAELVLPSETKNRVLAELAAMTPCIGILAFSPTQFKFYRYFDSIYESTNVIVEDKRMFLVVGDSYADERNGETKWPKLCKQYMGIDDAHWINVAVSGTGFTAGTAGSTDFYGQISTAPAIYYRYYVTDILVSGGLNDSKSGLSTNAEMQNALVQKMEAFNAYVRHYYPNARVHIFYLGNAIDSSDDYDGARRYWNERLFCRLMYNQHGSSLGWIVHEGTAYAFAGSTQMFYLDGVHPSMPGYQNYNNTNTDGWGDKACARVVESCLQGGDAETFCASHDAGLNAKSANGVTSCGMMKSEQINERILMHFTNSDGSDSGIYLGGEFDLSDNDLIVAEMTYQYYNRPSTYVLTAVITTASTTEMVPVVVTFEGFAMKVRLAESGRTISDVTSLVIYNGDFVEYADFVV